MDPRIQSFFKYLFCVISSFGACLLVLYHVVKNGISVFTVEPRVELPEILKDKDLGEHKYVNLKAQGVKLHYVEKGDKSKPMMLFLHGFPECWLSWHHQIKEFASSYWVVALDLRGYGDSEMPKGKKNYNMDIIVEDIREFVIEMGNPKTILVGHDWGGIIAWSTVEKYPELFTRHISLNGPPYHTFKNFLLGDISQITKSWYMFLFQCPFLPEIVLRLKNLSLYAEGLRSSTKSGSGNQVFPDHVVQGLQYYYSRSGAFTGPLNYYRSAFSYEEKPEEGKIKVPTLIVWGDEDKALSSKIPKLMTSICEDVKYDPVPGAGHFVHEEQPEAVNKIIWEYLKL